MSPDSRASNSRSEPNGWRRLSRPRRASRGSHSSSTHRARRPPTYSLRPVEAAAASFSVAPIGAAVREPADVDRVFDALAREPNGGLMVLPDISMTNYREAIVALAARHRVP